MAGDVGSIPGSGRSPGEGNGNPLQYSCLGNPHGQRSLVCYSPCSSTDLDMTEKTVGYIGLFGGSVVWKLPVNAGDIGLTLGLGRSPGEGNGNLLQYPFLGILWTEEPGGLQSMGL